MGVALAWPSPMIYISLASAPIRMIGSVGMYTCAGRVWWRKGVVVVEEVEVEEVVEVAG